MCSHCPDPPRLFPEGVSCPSVWVGSDTWPATVGFPKGPIQISRTAAAGRTRPKLFQNVPLAFLLGSCPGPGQRKLRSCKDPFKFQAMRSLPGPAKTFSRRCPLPFCLGRVPRLAGKSWISTGTLPNPKMCAHWPYPPPTFPGYAFGLLVGVVPWTWSAKVGFSAAPIKFPRCAPIARNRPELSHKVPVASRSGSGPALGRQKSDSSGDPSRS